MHICAPTVTCTVHLIGTGCYMADIASRSCEAHDWCTTYIILLYQCYTRLERSISLMDTIRRHLLHVDHPLDLRCHPLQFICSPFEVEGEGELIDEVVFEMMGKVVAEMVREVVVHLSRHYHHSPTPIFVPDTSIPPPPPPHTYPSPDTSIPPHTYLSPDTFILPHTYLSPDTSILP